MDKDKRHTLNVSKEVSAAVKALQAEELGKTGKNITADEVLRRLFKIGKAPCSKKR